jgi:putative solute:sodium symporter small subunit
MPGQALQPLADNAAMSRTAKSMFWARTKKLTGALLAVWLGVNLLVPWFARDLNAVQAFGFPLGYWLAAEGSLLVYLLIIVVYVVAMDRLEARCIDRSDEEAIGSTGSGPA